MRPRYPGPRGRRDPARPRGPRRAARRRLPGRAPACLAPLAPCPVWARRPEPFGLGPCCGATSEASSRLTSRSHDQTQSDRRGRTSRTAGASRPRTASRGETGSAHRSRADAASSSPIRVLRYRVTPRIGPRLVARAPASGPRRVVRMRQPRACSPCVSGDPDPRGGSRSRACGRQQGVGSGRSGLSSTRIAPRRGTSWISRRATPRQFAPRPRIP